MKTINKQTNLILTAILLVLSVYSCDDFEKFEPIGANSIADETPPSASFSYTQGQGLEEEWKDYAFANNSISATSYSWDFGDGNTSTDLDGFNTYPGEGMFTVTLTAMDNLGETSTFTETIDVVEPEEPLVSDPVLVNSDFDKLAKLGASDCSCSAWDNDDIGEQGESSTVNGVSSFLKFDNNEPDHVYQEFEVVPNQDYTILIVTSFKSISSTPGSYPGSMLELRVLAGSGYVSGYTPVYYATAPEFPNSGYGYTTVAQVEESANNLLTEAISNPGNQDYFTTPYTFNSGANNSVALFVRGIGGEDTGSYGYTSGDEEIRADSITITANN